MKRGIGYSAVGETFDDFLLIKEATKGMTSNGKPFLTLILRDATGEIEAKLWDAIATENAATPVEVNKGVVLEKVFIEGDYVTYTYSLNESILPIENVIQNAENSKQMMISAFHRTEKGNNFAQLCKDANKGILYYYVGSSSNRNCTIKIEPTDL